MASAKRFWSIVRTAFASSISCCLIMEPSSAIHAPREIEFSCSNTPFLSAARRKTRRRRRTYDCHNAAEDVRRAFEILDYSVADGGFAEAESPPASRREEEEEADESVDWAAEEFIRGFYEQLRRQKMPAKSPMLGFR